MNMRRKKVQDDPMIRIEIVKKNARLLSDFLSLGFKTHQVLKELFRVYYPEITWGQIRQIWDIRSRDEEVLLKFEKLINKLKSE